jgi:predicted nucleic acid-binding Zn ribbon protein
MMAYIKKTDRREPIEHFHCLVCGDPIDPARVVSKRVVTCSEEHARILKLEKRRLRGLSPSRCRMCGRPSTEAERAEFAAWRKDKAKKAGIRPGPKKKPEQPAVTPLEQHLGAISIQ